MCCAAGPIMEVVELEELEEEEEHQRLSSAAVSLSQNDLLEFLEGEVKEDSLVGGGVREPRLAEDVATPSTSGGEDSGKREQPVSGESMTQGSGEVEKMEEEKSGDQNSEQGLQKEADMDSKSPPQQGGEGGHTTTSLLEQRLRTSSTTRVKSLRRMRLVSGMYPQCLLQPAGPGGSWDHEQLTRGQFVVLMEQFLGLEPEQAILNALLLYIRDNYKETVEVREVESEGSSFKCML